MAPLRRVRPEGGELSLLVAEMEAPLLRLNVPEDRSRSGVDPAVDVVRKTPLELVGLLLPNSCRVPELRLRMPLLLRSRKEYLRP